MNKTPMGWWLHRDLAALPTVAMGAVMDTCALLPQWFQESTERFG
jgi:hypothetical protein